LDDKKKSNDIVKAVISFANAAGGTILIGVTDDAEIVGIDGNIPHSKDMAARLPRIITVAFASFSS
jgi:predicted HTH transcriptional regulator